jgi:hypothetical protein
MPPWPLALGTEEGEELALGSAPVDAAGGGVVGANSEPDADVLDAGPRSDDL